MSVERVRDRRRAETMAEIKRAAMSELADRGAAALSLRAVAREVGMTVQSLYHYFESRDALLSVLVSDGHNAVADHVSSAVEASRGRPALERRLAATHAYRRWARSHPEAFLLIYGTPVPGFEPTPHSDTRTAALRLAVPFREVVFDGWTPAELSALELPGGTTGIEDVHGAPLGLPPAALFLFIELRARMHGLVILELLAHLVPLEQHGDALFTAAMTRMSQDLDSAQRAAWRSRA